MHDGLILAAAVAFPMLIAGAVLYLLMLDRDPGTFRLAQFITDENGRGNSGSLAYVAALLVGTWLVYYEAISGRMSEGLLGLYLGTFVAGSVLRQGIGASERVGVAKAQRPGVDMPPLTAETVTTATTRVTPE